MAIIANAEVKTCVEAWSGKVSSGRHQFITDKPASFGGQDKGPAPYDFICTGLISCTMITLRMYAQHKGIELGTFSVEADFNANKEGREWISRRLSFEQTHQSLKLYYVPSRLKPQLSNSLDGFL